jgi:hypothetical protein
LLQNETLIQADSEGTVGGRQNWRCKKIKYINWEKGEERASKSLRRADMPLSTLFFFLKTEAQGFSEMTLRFYRTCTVPLLIRKQSQTILSSMGRLIYSESAIRIA